MARRKNLLVDLDDPRFDHQAVHESLEAVDAIGVVPTRDHHAPEALLGWVDEVFGGHASSEVATGGVWTFARDGRRIALASYDIKGLPFHWLKHWTTRGGIAVLGPFGLARRGDSHDTIVPAETEEERLIERVLLHATLSSVRERGYRRALIPAVTDERAAFYASEAGAYWVENVDTDRGGRRYRTTVMASGNGSNFEAVARAARDGEVPLELERLIVNRHAAYALRRAASHGIAADVVAWDRAAESRDRFDERVLAAVAGTEPELVLMLGWMHVMPATFVMRFPQIANLHPAFLPLDPAADRVTMPDGTTQEAFRGAHAVDDAVAAGARWFGASVHRVGVAVDRGRILARSPLRLDVRAERGAIERELHDAERRTLTSALRRWRAEMP